MEVDAHPRARRGRRYQILQELGLQEAVRRPAWVLRMELALMNSDSLGEQSTVSVIKPSLLPLGRLLGCFSASFLATLFSGNVTREQEHVTPMCWCQ